MYIEENEVENIINETILFWRINPETNELYRLEELKLENIRPIVRSYIYRTLQTSMPSNRESQLTWDWSETNIYDQIIYLEELTDEIEIHQNHLFKFHLLENDPINNTTLVIYQILLDHLMLFVKDLEARSKQP